MFPLSVRFNPLYAPSPLADLWSSPLLGSTLPRFSTAPAVCGFRNLPSWFEEGPDASPNVNFHESDKAVMLEFEVPRFRRDDLTLAFDKERSTVTVSGKRTRSHHREELGDFSRTFAFSRDHFDVSKVTSALDCGVLTVTVPKAERALPPTAGQVADKRSTVFGGSPSGELVSKTTPEEFRAVRESRWPPVVRTDETAGAVTYKCEMPPTVTKDHIAVELKGRTLTLTVSYDYNVQSGASAEYQSMSYSSSFSVPKGTTVEDISTSYDGGVLTISVAKRQPLAVDGPKTAQAGGAKKAEEGKAEKSQE